MMSRKVLSRVSILIVLFFAIVVCSPSCGLFKRGQSKPIPEEVVMESNTIRLMGYERTVTIKGTPKELIKFMAKATDIMPSWMQMDEIPLGEDGMPPLGGTSFFKVKAMGIEIKGRLITVKSEPDKIWFVWDNPQVFMVLRWDFKQVKDGTRVTFAVTSELPYSGVYAMEDLADYGSKVMFRDIDVVLARTQANFDPAVEPEDLVGPEHSGDIFEAFVQSHEAKLWIDSDPDKIVDWVLDPDNFPIFMEEFKVERADLEKYQAAPLEDVVYAPAVFKSGIIRSKFDLFFVKRKKGRGYILKIFTSGFGRVGLIKQAVSPEKGGGMSSFQALFEIPSMVSTPDRMDMMQYLGRVPQLLQEKALMIKQGVENRAS